MNEHSFAAPVPNLLLHGASIPMYWSWELYIRLVGPYDWAKEEDTDKFGFVRPKWEPCLTEAEYEALIRDEPLLDGSDQ